MIVWPLLILRVSLTGGWWWMEVIPRIVGVWMSIPATRPRLTLPLFLILHIEIIIPVPANLQLCCYFTWVILARQYDSKMEFSVRNELG